MKSEQARMKSSAYGFRWNQLYFVHNLLHSKIRLLSKADFVCARRIKLQLIFFSEIFDLRRMWNNFLAKIVKYCSVVAMWNEICPHSRQQIFHSEVISLALRANFVEKSFTKDEISYCSKWLHGSRYTRVRQTRQQGKSHRDIQYTFYKCSSCTVRWPLICSPQI